MTRSRSSSVCACQSPPAALSLPSSLLARREWDETYRQGRYACAPHQHNKQEVFKTKFDGLRREGLRTPSTSDARPQTYGSVARPTAHARVRGGVCGGRWGEGASANSATEAAATTLLAKQTHTNRLGLLFGAGGPTKHGEAANSVYHVAQHPPSIARPLENLRTFRVVQLSQFARILGEYRERRLAATRTLLRGHPQTCRSDSMRNRRMLRRPYLPIETAVLGAATFAFVEPGHRHYCPQLVRRKRATLHTFRACAHSRYSSVTGGSTVLHLVTMRFMLRITCPHNLCLGPTITKRAIGSRKHYKAPLHVSWVPQPSWPAPAHAGRSSARPAMRHSASKTPEHKGNSTLRERATHSTKQAHYTTPRKAKRKTLTADLTSTPQEQQGAQCKNISS